MPIRGRVGRHARHGGQHCQNWPDDQQNVIGLLNRIAVNDGGTGGGLNGNIGGRIVAGMASDALYRAIMTFEDKHFPGQRSGFVDPAGGMLKRLEELAARAVKVPANDLAPEPIDLAPPPVIDSALDRLRRSIGDDTPYRKFPMSQQVAMGQLVMVAVMYVDSLKARGLERLPSPVELFGRAYFTKGKLATRIRGDLEFIADGGKSERPPPITERFGGSVDILADITTGESGALLLYESGACCRVYPHHWGRVLYLGDRYGGKSWNQPQPV
ncbi:MAG TPA: hypothetical protein VJR58_19285 [Vineibacter sp.]|nr:hypothetical protein [Vineibacter sp.]